jgi:glycerol-3-phosphate dehydrogenase
VSDSLEVSAIVNATGAWVDLTLKQLDIASEKLMGGTKGSHFITFHEGLRQALGDQALYAEAEDGRPIFILPFGECVLVGTTDLPFSGPPQDALATDAELDYLIAAVNIIMPQVELTRADLELHYCGVRPLPASDAATPASVTRRHKLVDHRASGPCPVPTFSVVGGKLTTSRQLAEEAAATVLASLERQPARNSQNRFVPGGMEHPGSPDELAAAQNQMAGDFYLSRDQVAAAWPLFGTRLRQVLTEARRSDPGDQSPWQNLPGTNLPVPVVKWIIEHESPRTLDDLVERRLMLLYHRPLTARCLHELADVLAACGVIPREQVGNQLAATSERLRTHFGKTIADA